jgi:methylphosphotriester-DNA--protein-cysteine methyltransferase
MAMGQINTGNADTTQAALANGYESISGFRDAFKNWLGGGIWRKQWLLDHEQKHSL